MQYMQPSMDTLEIYTIAGDSILAVAGVLPVLSNTYQTGAPTMYAFDLCSCGLCQNSWVGSTQLVLHSHIIVYQI